MLARCAPVADGMRGSKEDDIMMTNGQKTRNLTQLVELPVLRCEVDCEMRNMF